MKTTSKRNLYFSVLGVCAVGLLVDRTVLQPQGAEASAGAEAAPESAVVAAPPVVAPVPASSAAGPTGVGVVAAQLMAISERGSIDLVAIPDAFMPPASWLPEQGVQVYDDQSAEEETAKFLASHRLTAVLTGGAIGQAIIDGRGVRVGEKLDGFRLLQVGPDVAVFEFEGRRVSLVIER